MSRKRFFLAYGILFLAALLLRMTVAVFANHGEIKTVRPDTAGYFAPARSLAANGTYEGTRRPPGFPLLAAAVFKCGGGERFLSFLLAGFSAFTVLAVARAGFLCGGHPAALIAGWLCALNPTALGNAPLLLTDSWAGVFVALQYWFFLEFYRKRKWQWLYGCAAVAAWGALIRPVNSLFILPLLFLLAVMPEMKWQKKCLHGVGCAVLFFAIIAPWMFRNAAQGAGFTIDTNTGAMYHQNGAMLMGEVTGKGYEFEKQRIIAEQTELFADTVRFPDEKSREKYRITQYRKLVIKHFPLWLKQQFNYQILLPDLPSFTECLGISRSDRGTMAVLKEQGMPAAVRHYFGEKWLWMISALLPLIAVALLTCAGSLFYLIEAVIDWKRSRMEIFIFGAFVYYYLFLPGAIVAPRYQIPALPCLAVTAALALLRMWRKFRKTGEIDEVPGDVESSAA
ncbi:MAG: hypothetical protein E7042_00025 [Lentisphaerae bacterium]|nr:hypothetical protein [Lentisphaerota bacterium]